jgi:starch-binding outer membrane protein, SusD/RagB family
MLQKNIITIALFTLTVISCTKLEEEFEGNLTADQVGSGSGSGNASALLKGVYDNMRLPFTNHENVYALWETTTDELLVPTRGPDWDDNGVWRVLYSQKWTGDHRFINGVFNSLNGVNYSATELLRFNPTPQQAAEGRFLRAMAQFMLLDGWDQVPYREPGGSALEAPKVRKGLEALDYIVSEINAVLPALPNGPNTIANKDAARVLLMKCYLNKGAFANRAAPTFAPADMQQVITLADQIIANPAYSFSANYFDNFAPSNNALGKENIWAQETTGGVGVGSELRSRVHSTIHYNQAPGGWNGFSTLSDFYAKFEASDTRRGTAYPTGDPTKPNPGKRTNVGFLVGQQYDLSNDAPLQAGNIPLAYTPEVKLIETGTNLEVTGIRVYKYAVDWPNAGSGNWNNDYVYFRLADVMLMKAEALLRTNAAGPALTIVNSIRTNRGATPLATLTLDNLLDERGREMYAESWRRQDLIRFGKFLAPKQLKSDVSAASFLVFPIPNQQVAANPNITQNPGY